MEKKYVSIVGAGPGDPELLTLKALKRIKEADVILYDALISREILSFASPDCKLVYVGKRCSRHGQSQDAINLLLVQAAFTFSNVVRLKGGDPFIYGRGHEELEYLRNFNIEAEVVPGLSSATSLSTIQKVPLTRREYSDSFWILTGTTKDHELSRDLFLAVKSNASLVILMASKKIKAVADLFVHEGKPDLPAMLIINGSLKNEICITATIASLPERISNIKMEGPGTLVIGHVVELHPHFYETLQYSTDYDTK